MFCLLVVLSLRRSRLEWIVSSQSVAQNVLRIRDSKYSSIIDELATLLRTVWDTIEALRAMLPVMRMTVAFLTLLEAALVTDLPRIVYN